MFLNCLVICIDDDISYAGIFLTHLSYYFYVWLAIDMRLVLQELNGIVPYSIPFEASPLHSYIGDLIIHEQFISLLFHFPLHRDN